MRALYTAANGEADQAVGTSGLTRSGGVGDSDESVQCGREGGNCCQSSKIQSASSVADENELRNRSLR